MLIHSRHTLRTSCLVNGQIWRVPQRATLKCGAAPTLRQRRQNNDQMYELREGVPIALVSLGATRRMTIRAKGAPRRTTHIDLEPGSLLVMDYATQLHYTHGVPKTNGPVGERISMAFRVKPDRTRLTKAEAPSTNSVVSDNAVRTVRTVDRRLAFYVL